LKKKLGTEQNDSKQEGTFNLPQGMTVNNELLYVCDYGNHRIQALSKDSYSYLFQFGQEGTENGQFLNPYCIYYYDYTVFIGDFISVQLFNYEGNFIQKIANKMDKLFGFVVGLCVVRGILYVCDRDNDRIKVFRLVSEETP